MTRTRRWTPLFGAVGGGVALGLAVGVGAAWGATKWVERYLLQDPDFRGDGSH